MEVDIDLMALAMTPDIGPITSRTLISYCGSAHEVFKSGRKQLRRIPGIGGRSVEKIMKSQYHRQAEKELSYCQKHDIRVIAYTDPLYPERLRQIESAPILLYVRGNTELNPPRVLGVVGTRQATPYGLAQCAKIIKEVERYGCVIVSGLAYGIDSCAHKASIANNMVTWGVMGNGMDRIYPSIHRKLAAEMVDCRGCLITEFPSFVKADRERFPARNRILASLCDAILVVESKARGGSMITADFAFDYNRDVFALPGRSTDEKSAGCLSLIRSNKAALIRNGTDIAKSLFWDVEHSGKSQQSELFYDLEPDEKELLNILDKGRPVHLQELIVKSGIPSSKLVGTLLKLEFKEVIRALPGNQYMHL
jgi:DNA processing protein